MLPEQLIFADFLVTTLFQNGNYGSLYIICFYFFFRRHTLCCKRFLGLNLFCFFPFPDIFQNFGLPCVASAKPGITCTANGPENLIVLAALPFFSISFSSFSRSFCTALMSFKSRSRL